jgi:hypothetical protein
VTPAAVLVYFRVAEGRSHKVTVEAKTAAEALVDDPIYREQLALDPES